MKLGTTLLNSASLFSTVIVGAADESAPRYKKMEIASRTETVPLVGQVSVWQPARSEPRAVFIALHGIQTNQTWFILLGEQLARRGFSLWAYTRPSMSPKPTADTKEWKAWCDQLEAVRDVARIRGRPVLAMGVSWGARPVLASVIRQPKQWSGSVLLNPALKTKRDGAFLWRAFCAGAPVFRTTTFAIPLSQHDYTNNKVTWDQWLSPCQLTTRCTTRFFGQTFKIRREADRKLSELGVPTLALLGGNDPLVLNDAAASMLDAAHNPQVEVKTIPTGTHAMLVEQPSEVAKRIEQWERRMQGR